MVYVGGIIVFVTCNVSKFECYIVPVSVSHKMYMKLVCT